MLFNSIQYVLFLPIVAAIYWVVPARVRPVLLLAASYYFYMSWMPTYGLLLAGLTAWNFAFGLLVSAGNISQSSRRLAFIAAITGNLACLALFKYTNFLIEAFWSAAHTVCSWIHAPSAVPPAAPLLNIILPLGISFFVFEFIHYLVDVYKGSAALKNPIRFALFAAFFPSQIAGPIKRFQDFDQQVVEEKPFDKPMFGAGLSLILEGMFKKVVLGDNLAGLVQAGFSNATQLGTVDAWLAVIAFTLQIYYDFSGYTDIGRGSAMVLGYRLPENFNMPYIARNLQDFWHRWHISLSTWLRDYLYIPLGGSKHGPARQARNLFATMLLGGLWHGAAWHYVAWGAFHGAGLVVTHSWQKFAASIPSIQKLRETLGWDICGRLLTLLLVMIGWVVFRADNFPQALSMYSAMFSLHSSQIQYDTVHELLRQSVIPLGLCLYAVYHLMRGTGRTNATVPESSPIFVPLFRDVPLAARALAVAALGLMIVGFAPHKAIPFIYFQF